MAGSIRGGLPIFSFKGIGVFIHWTFLLSPAYIAFSGWQDGMVLSEILQEVGLVLIVFVCVLLHEFGHSLTALRYGVRTKNIVLLPIGGVASLERMPEEPHKEFWITLAGPMVNLVIALLAFGLIAITGVTESFSDILLGATEWTSTLMFIFGMNIFLFLFNLIPAYPMDGGRLLRSLLSMRMPRPKATKIAGRIGQVMAVLFVLAAIYQEAPFLGLIGVFIFMAAGAEIRTLAPKTTANAGLIRSHMTSTFTSLLGTNTVAKALEELARNDEELIVVLDTNEVKGIITRDELLATSPETLLSALSITRVPACRINDMAEHVGRYMLTHGYPISLVMENGSLVGIVTAASLREQVAPLSGISVQRPEVL